MQTIDSSILKKLNKPDPTSHKGDNGRVLVIAGSEKYHGALLLAIQAASRIVDVVYVYTWEGNQRLVEQLKSEIAVFINIKSDELWEKVEQVDAILIGPGLSEDKNTKKILEKILKKIKPDVVHANNIHFYLSYHSIKLAKTYSKVTVVTLRDTMSFSFGKLKTEKYLKNFDAHLTWLDQLKQARKRWNPLRNLIIKYYLGYADKKFAVSKALKKALEQNGIKNVEVIHTGTDIAEWQVLPDKVKSFKKRHGLEEKKVIFFSGRLSISKGANVTFEVIEKISQEFPDVILLVAGTGSNIKERNNLKFTGWIDREEIKLAYAASDVVLVPSLYLDPFPRVVIEAMAAGKPVVGTCYGGTPEAILDGVTGFVVNPFNTKEMAEKTLDLLRDSDKARRFGKAGRERVRNTFNLDEKIKNILACYYREFGIK